MSAIVPWLRSVFSAAFLRERLSSAMWHNQPLIPSVVNSHLVPHSVGIITPLMAEVHNPVDAAPDQGS